MWWNVWDGARHLRALLAAAGDDVHGEAVDALASGTAQDESSLRWMLFCSLGTPGQVASLALRFGLGHPTIGVVATLVDGAGPAGAVPLLARSLDEPGIAAAHARLLANVLAALPADEAFQALLDRLDRKHVPVAAAAAADAFPARAVRLLAGSAAAGAPGAVELLTAQTITRPDLVDELLPGLPDESRAAIEALRASTARAPEAPPGTLPPLLTEPPWTRPRAGREPVVIKDLPYPGARTIDWEPGERDAWNVDLHHLWRWVDRLDWRVQVARFKRDELMSRNQPLLFVEGPEELVRPLLAGWEPPDVWDVAEWMRAVVHRFGLDAFDAAFAAASWNPAKAGGLLMPFLSDETALLMAGWLRRLQQPGATARAWFRRHGHAAVPALLPRALGAPGAGRDAAEAALRLIAAEHGPEGIVEAARVHGGAVVAAIEEFLSADPLEILPAKTPVPGGWADVRLLPRILLRDRAHALPDDAARHVLTMLLMSRPGDVFAGVGVVRELCDPGSLAEFGWALFTRWEANGAPAKEGWALTQLGLTGDDETVRRLAPRIRAWPGERGHAKAVNGLDVLASIGTDVALMHLHGIAQRVRFNALRGKAREKIEEVAAGLGLSAEELADRLVPDFGLDAAGAMTLDYGPRRFVVGFDERLKPYVTGEDGKRRKALPKPGAKDDPDLAPAAHKAFATLKKDVRTVAAGQLRRLETRMVTRRRWPVREFRELLAGHPLVRHIVRRLVWLADDGGTVTAFRVAEDGTFADVADDAVTFPEPALVGIAHPIDLDGSLPAWSELFADYEIMQPFPQLGRPVHRLEDGARGGWRLARFEGLTVPVGKILGLTSRGWRRGDPMDAGVECWISRSLPSGRFLVVELDPGIAVGAPDAMPDQTLRTVALTTLSPSRFWTDAEPTCAFADLDAVTASEILTDLTDLTAP
ncbi:DUF4132 domain-containing protein [Spirillospora sp. NBC_00431]